MFNIVSEFLEFKMFSSLKEDGVDSIRDQEFKLFNDAYRKAQTEDLVVT